MAPSQNEFDFFVSYARADNHDGWISKFVEQLVYHHSSSSNDHQLVPFFDTDEIKSFDDWQQRLYDGLAKSRLFLAFVSPRYFASEWCRREWRTWIDLEIAKHILSEGAAPLSIVEVPGLLEDIEEFDVARNVAKLCELCPPHDQFLDEASPQIRQFRRRQISEFTSFYSSGEGVVEQPDFQKVLKKLGLDLAKRSKDVKLAGESPTSVPPYNKHFSGRSNELFDLRKQLRDDQAGVVCVIQGLGGIGKTELAYTYAHAYAGHYPGGRFLLRCEGKKSLVEATLSLGGWFRDQISDDERMWEETYFEAILRCLRERINRLGNVLLVLDNVTDPQLLAAQETDRLTSLGGKVHLLATTRLPTRTGSSACWTTLDEMPEPDALALLEKFRPFQTGSTALQEKEAARKIVKRLRGFALVVEMVGAYLAAHPKTSYADMANDLALDEIDLIAEHDDFELRRHNHERRLQAILGPTLSELTPPERLAVEYAACLASDQVPLPWLHDLVAGHLPELASAENKGNWSQVCENLLARAIFSPADRNQENGEEESNDPKLRIVRIHQLVQDLVRQQLSEDELTERESAIKTFVELRHTEISEAAKWSKARWQIEPLDALANLWADKDRENATFLLGSVSSFWLKLAEYSRAEKLSRRAVSLEEQVSGPEGAIRVSLQSINLFNVLYATNQLEEAESVIRCGLKISESFGDSNSPHVAKCLQNLSVLLSDTNRLDEAEIAIRRALAIYEMHLSEIDDGLVRTCDVANSLTNLASVLRESDRFEESEPLLERALALAEEDLDEDHDIVATILTHLAELFRDTQRLEKAEPFYRRAIAIRKEAYGTAHPHYANALSGLGATLWQANRLKDAEPVMREVVSVYENSLDEDHPIFANSLHDLGQVLKLSGREDEAEQYFRRSIEIWKNAYNDKHPQVAIGLDSLSTLLSETNRKSDAEPLMRRAVEITEQSYGENHTQVARRLNNLAMLLGDDNRPAEAAPLMERSVQILEKQLDKDHPDLQQARWNLDKLKQKNLADNPFLKAFAAHAMISQGVSNAKLGEQLLRDIEALEEFKDCNSKGTGSGVCEASKSSNDEFVGVPEDKGKSTDLTEFDEQVDSPAFPWHPPASRREYVRTRFDEGQTTVVGQAIKAVITATGLLLFILGINVVLQGFGLVSIPFSENPIGYEKPDLWTSVTTTVYSVGPLLGIVSCWLYAFVFRMERILKHRLLALNAEGIDNSHQIDRLLELEKEAHHAPSSTKRFNLHQMIKKRQASLMGRTYLSWFTVIVLLAINWFAIGLQFYFGTQWFFDTLWISVPVLAIWVLYTFSFSGRILAGRGLQNPL